MNGYPVQQQIIYQSEPHTVQTLKSLRERTHTTIRQYMNHRVRVQTIDGHTFEGVIINIEGGFLYLSVPPNPHQHRQFVNPLYQSYQYNNVILPLVLYELLVISLL